MRDEFEFHGLRECPAYNRVDTTNRAGCQPLSQLFGVKRLNMRRREFAEFHAAKRGVYMTTHLRFVVTVGARSDARLRAIRQPPRHVLGDSYLACVKGKSASRVSLRFRLGGGKFGAGVGFGLRATIDPFASTLAIVYPHATLIADRFAALVVANP